MAQTDREVPVNFAITRVEEHPALEVKFAKTEPAPKKGICTPYILCRLHALMKGFLRSLNACADFALRSPNGSILMGGAKSGQAGLPDFDRWAASVLMCAPVVDGQHSVYRSKISSTLAGPSDDHCLTTLLKLTAWAHDLGHLSNAEQIFIHHQRYVQTQRILRAQRLIERDLIVARREGDRNLYIECRRDLQELNRQFWNLASIIKAKVLVGRKGTERSNGKSGSQTLCTHTLSLFDSDLSTRWLLGLLSKLTTGFRLQRKLVRRDVAFRSSAGTLCLDNPSFQLGAA
jgi:hypothetical protein